jgi:hypothetical protein
MKFNFMLTQNESTSNPTGYRPWRRYRRTGTFGRHATYDGCHHAARAAIVCILGLMACSVEEFDDVDDRMGDLGSNQQPLALFFEGWKPWQSGVVPYCYQPTAPSRGLPQPGSASYEDSVQMVEAAVAKYEAVPNDDIDFQGGGLCDNWDDYIVGTDPGTLRIIITDTDAATRTCVVGSIATQSTKQWCPDFEPNGEEIIILFGEGYQAPDAGILHELGHALGFRHEMSRLPDEEQCDEDSTAIPDNGITEYDHDSIMSATYCHGATELSKLDKVGLSFVYPGPGADRLTVPFAFQVSNELVAGRGDNVVEFAQRVAGVQEHHYSDADWWRNTGAGTVLIGTGSSLPLATALGPGSSALVSGRFTDIFGRLRSTPPTTIRQDSGLHAALILNAIW